MSSRSSSRFVMLYVLPVLALAALLWGANNRSNGQVNNNNNNGGFFNRQVGGVAVNADGVVARTSVADYKAVRDETKGLSARVPAELSKATELRKISLRGLEAACRESLETKTPLPDEIAYLSGIQRIQYVIAYPEQNDIVLAGPGEGWKLDENFNVVGVTTGQPVMHVDDLLIALRSVQSAKQQGISCSIDPTAEGRRKLDIFLKKQKTFSQAAVDGMEQALGPQQVTLTGVPAESHFARVLVSADFQMKRLAMHLEPAPIAGLPSFLSMMQAKKTNLDNMVPRWWMACNYEPLGKSEDGLTWEIRGQGVKVLTEDDYVSASGAVKGSGKKNPVAQEWADNMTKKYTELAAKAPIFAELRNIMDLSVVAALLHKEDLCGVAGCQLPLLSSADSPLAFAHWNAPKTIATHCSFMKAGKEYIITASGGVQVESFDVVQKSVVSQQLPKVRDKAASGKTSKAWYWN